jgi:hypothetical protein
MQGLKANPGKVLISLALAAVLGISACSSDEKEPKSLSESSSSTTEVSTTEAHAEEAMDDSGEAMDETTTDSYADGADVPADENAENVQGVELSSLVYENGEALVTWWGSACDRVAAINTSTVDGKFVVDVQVGNEAGNNACVKKLQRNRAKVAIPGRPADQLLADKNAK